MQFVDMILHVDKSLGRVIAEYGQLVYGVLWGIVFAETGLVVFPFLPGGLRAIETGSSRCFVAS